MLTKFISKKNSMVYDHKKGKVLRMGDTREISFETFWNAMISLRSQCIADHEPYEIIQEARLEDCTQ